MTEPTFTSADHLISDEEYRVLKEILEQMGLDHEVKTDFNQYRHSQIVVSKFRYPLLKEKTWNAEVLKRDFHHICDMDSIVFHGILMTICSFLKLDNSAKCKTSEMLIQIRGILRENYENANSAPVLEYGMGW